MAGGFMAGFADGFNKSYTSAVERQRDREDDTFKLRYMDAIKRRDQYAAEKKQDKKDIEYAKAMARAYGQPEAAWQEIYQMKRSGADESTIVKVLSENTFTGSDTTKTADVATDGGDLSKAAGSSVDAQMKSSGMATPADGGIFSTTSTGQAPQPAMGAPGMGQAGQNRVNERVDETVGTPADQVGLDTGTADPSHFPAAPTAPDQAAQASEAPAGAEPVAPAPAAPEPAADTPVASKGPWTPKTKEDDYYKANNVAEAQVGLVKAERTRNPATIQLARDVLDANIAAEALKTEMDAKAKGLLDTPQLAAVQIGPDPAKDWDYLRPGKEKGTWVSAKNPDKIYRDGEVTVFKKEMTDQMNEQSKAIREPATKYRQSVTGFIANVRNADELMKNVTENPGVAGWAGYASKSADELVRNVGGVMALAQEDIRQDGILSSTNEKQLDDSIEAMKKQLSTFVGPATQNNISRMAIARRLYEAQATKMAYAQAASVGQTGQGVAAKEFERFYNQFMNPNEDALKQSLTTYVTQNYDTLKQEGAALNEFNPDIDAFYQIYGVPSPLKPAPDIDQLLDLSPDTRSAFDRMTHQQVVNDPNQANPNQINTAPPGMKAIGKSPEGKIIYEDENGERWVQ